VCSKWKFTDVSEEYPAPTVRVEEKAKKSVKRNFDPENGGNLFL
jgi:hypothetical protein